MLIAGLDHEAYAARHPGSESVWIATDERAAETVPVAPDEHAAHALDHMAGWAGPRLGRRSGCRMPTSSTLGRGCLILDSIAFSRFGLRQRSNSVSADLPGDGGLRSPHDRRAHHLGLVPFLGAGPPVDGGTGLRVSPSLRCGLPVPWRYCDLESFWAFLDEGGQAIGPIPADRWKVDALYDPEQGKPGRSYVRRCVPR